jgi:hypothetical protein
MRNAKFHLGQGEKESAWQYMYAQSRFTTCGRALQLVTAPRGRMHTTISIRMESLLRRHYHIILRTPAILDLAESFMNMKGDWRTFSVWCIRARARPT